MLYDLARESGQQWFSLGPRLSRTSRQGGVMELMVVQFLIALVLLPGQYIL
jgi:hypothetical protein